MLRLCNAILAASLFLAPFAMAQEEVTLEPSKDNTLFQDSEGALSNGAGRYLFVGTTGTGTFRRAVLAFDLESAVPNGAQIQNVTLRLHMSRTISGSEPASVHRLTADWGEGTSDAAAEEGGGTAAATNDATWIHRFYDAEIWASAGGDFEAAASATFDVDGNGSYSVTSEDMADDVRSWLADPSMNFGWILIGNEDERTTAKRFDSRESGAADNRPQLTITFTTDTAAERPDVPRTLRLTGNYPNPFVESTTIHYEVERPQSVSLTLFDVLGREVRSLVRGHRAAGPHDVVVSSDGLPAGTYLYCFEGGGRCGRMTLLP